MPPRFRTPCRSGTLWRRSTCDAGSPRVSAPPQQERGPFRGAWRFAFPRPAGLTISCFGQAASVWPHGAWSGEFIAGPADPALRVGLAGLMARRREPRMRADSPRASAAVRPVDRGRQMRCDQSSFRSVTSLAQSPASALKGTPSGRRPCHPILRHFLPEATVNQAGGGRSTLRQYPSWAGSESKVCETEMTPGHYPCRCGVGRHVNEDHVGSRANRPRRTDWSHRRTVGWDETVG